MTPLLSDREKLRILRAADEGRLYINRAGRYVIDGDDKRPERKVRESLMHSAFILWPCDGNVCRITIPGRMALAHYERTGEL